ncbi:MAG: biotin synthase BioB [Candidatus Omnitrophica bacterium]|nr:biotin synthase BioB [Candidatus Omnitrophota bacterium]
MTNIERIREIKSKVLRGERVSREEARFLIHLEDREDIQDLTQAALEITRRFSKGKFDLCSLINAKSGMCTEDCGFCSQSIHFETGVSTYPLVDKETALSRAELMKANGADSYCLVCSGDQLSDRDFEQICETLSYVRQRVDIDLDCSIGFLDRKRAERLREIGVRRVNHNLQSSREFYPKIVTTHSYDDRLNTLNVLKEAGLEICCGGIIGMGESREDRIQLALQLTEVEPTVVPINFLNPREGTPLEGRPKIEPLELIKTIAVFRFILPKVILELAGGREVNLGDLQLDAVLAGANGLIIGGYLTTPAGEVEKDRDLVRSAGYELAPSDFELNQAEKV